MFFFVVHPGMYSVNVLLVSQVDTDTIFLTYFLGNLASNGTATQSSTSADWFAEKAIDGNRGLQRLRTGCSSTLNQTNPWWRLDLSSVYRVSRVVVTNRNDCCTFLLVKGVEIRIGNSLENNGNNNAIYSCNGMVGLYVNLIIPGNMKTLTLCEVEVFGEENIAIKGKAVQSSICYLKAQIAIDDSDFYCTHTETKTNPWRLDMTALQIIQEVIITNRMDCCFEQINGSEISEIRIGNSLENFGNNNPICAVIASIPAGASYSYLCPDMEGRYVNIVIPGDDKFLTLCEVEVYWDTITTST
uniref:Fucolectin tachylectin-4 pentraxin-1 domain-containing protein n=1 Tax=Sinocyclocheilus rhinocerous TaxID=307959 RepID=A0A673HFY0_9TELE